MSSVPVRICLLACLGILSVAGCTGPMGSVRDRLREVSGTFPSRVGFPPVKAGASRALTGHDARCGALEQQVGDALQSDDPERAGTLCVEILELQPNSVFAHHHLAVLADRDNRFAEAERHYLAALAAEPGNADVLSSLGWSYLLQGRHSEALQVLQQALQQQPGHPTAIFNLGWLAGLQGDEARAVAYFRRQATEVEAEQLLSRVRAEARQRSNSGQDLARLTAPDPRLARNAAAGQSREPATTPTSVVTGADVPDATEEITPADGQTVVMGVRQREPLGQLAIGEMSGADPVEEQSAGSWPDDRMAADGVRNSMGRGGHQAGLIDRQDAEAPLIELVRGETIRVLRQDSGELVINGEESNSHPDEGQLLPESEGDLREGTRSGSSAPRLTVDGTDVSRQTDQVPVRDAGGRSGGIAAIESLYRVGQVLLGAPDPVRPPSTDAVTGASRSTSDLEGEPQGGQSVGNAIPSPAHRRALERGLRLGLPAVGVTFPGPPHTARLD